IDGQNGDMWLSDPRRLEFWSRGYEQQHAMCRDPIHCASEHFQARGIRPMRILQNHQCRILLRYRLHLGGKRRERSLSSLLWGEFKRRKSSVIRQRQHFGKQRRVLSGRGGLRQYGIELIEFVPRAVCVRELRGTLHLADDRVERAVGVLRRTEIAQCPVRFGRNALQQRRSQARLADTRLSGKQHHLSLAVFCLGPSPQQDFEFFFSPDKLGHAAWMQGLEAAFDRSWSQRRPSARRPRNTFEILGSEVL